MVIDSYMLGAVDFAEINEIPYILFHTVPFSMECIFFFYFFFLFYCNVVIVRPILCETDAEESENWMKYTKCLIINTYFYAKYNYEVFKFLFFILLLLLKYREGLE